MGTFGAEEDLWRFDTVQEAWEIVKTVGEKPEQRSFHVMQVLGVHLLPLPSSALLDSALPDPPPLLLRPLQPDEHELIKGNRKPSTYTPAAPLKAVSQPSTRSPSAP